MVWLPPNCGAYTPLWAYVLAAHSSNVDCSGKPLVGSGVGVSIVVSSHAPVMVFFANSGLRRLWQVPQISPRVWNGDTSVDRCGACGSEPRSATMSNGPRRRSSGSTTIMAAPGAGTGAERPARIAASSAGLPAWATGSTRRWLSPHYTP